MIIVLTVVDDQRPAGDIGFPPTQGDETVKNLGPQDTVGIDMLVRHVAGMRPAFRQIAMAAAGGVEVPAGRAESAIRVADIPLVQMEPQPAIAGQSGDLDDDQDAFGRPGQRRGPDDLSAGIQERAAGGRQFLGLRRRRKTDPEQGRQNLPHGDIPPNPIVARAGLA